MGTTENPVEVELVRIALVRIEQDPSQFDTFVDMLRDTEGMIVTTLTGELGYSVSYIHIRILVLSCITDDLYSFTLANGALFVDIP